MGSSPKIEFRRRHVTELLTGSRWFLGTKRRISEIATPYHEKNRPWLIRYVSEPGEEQI